MGLNCSTCDNNYKPPCCEPKCNNMCYYGDEYIERSGRPIYCDENCCDDCTIECDIRKAMEEANEPQ